VYYQNVRGLRTKLEELRCGIQSITDTFDIIILVETWLCDGIMDAELGLENYRIFRQDRNANNSNYSRGGGVLVAVRDCYMSRALSVPKPALSKFSWTLEWVICILLFALFIFLRIQITVFMNLIVVQLKKLC